MTDPKDFARLIICNTYGERPKWWQAPLYWAIRAYQIFRTLSQHGVNAIHTIIKLSTAGYNEWQSTTAPKTIRLALEYGWRRRYTFWEYVHADQFTEKGYIAAQVAADRLLGTEYDYGQLAQFASDFLDWNIVFDFSDKREVCSTAAAIILLAAIQADGLPDPFDGQRPTSIFPAFFEHSHMFRQLEDHHHK